MIIETDNGPKEIPDFIPGLSGLSGYINKRSIKYAEQESQSDLLNIYDILDRIDSLVHFIYKTNSFNLLPPEERNSSFESWAAKTGFDTSSIKLNIYNNYIKYFDLNGILINEAPDVLKYRNYDLSKLPSLQELYADIILNKPRAYMNKIKAVRSCIDYIKHVFNIRFIEFKPYSDYINIPPEIKPLISYCCSFNVNEFNDYSYNMEEYYIEQDDEPAEEDIEEYYSEQDDEPAEEDIEEYYSEQDDEPEIDGYDLTKEINGLNSRFIKIERRRKKQERLKNLMESLKEQAINKIYNNIDELNNGLDDENIIIFNYKKL